MTAAQTIYSRLQQDGWADYGYCQCSARARSFKKGKWTIKVYGNRAVGLYWNKQLIKTGNDETLEEIIQATSVQAG